MHVEINQHVILLLYIIIFYLSIGMISATQFPLSSEGEKNLFSFGNRSVKQKVKPYSGLLIILKVNCRDMVKGCKRQLGQKNYLYPLNLCFKAHISSLVSFLYLFKQIKLNNMTEGRKRQTFRQM